MCGFLSRLQGRTISKGGYAEDKHQNTYTPTVAQPVTVLQSGLLEHYGVPLIYEGPDPLESTSVYELCSGSPGTQIAPPPIQLRSEQLPAGTAPCRPLVSGYS